MDRRLLVMGRSFQPRQWFRGEGDADPYVISEEDALMWVYQERADGAYEVGFYTPTGEWVVESIHDDKDGAAARVNYLNGGRG